MFIEKIRRVTRDGRWIPEIDGLRFLALFSVFLFHVGGELANRTGRFIPIEPRYSGLFHVIGNGDRGVRLFFVISGMILALPFARHYLAGDRPVSLRKYYLRRVTRLEPPFILSTILIVLLEAVNFHFRMPAGYWGHALAGLFYLHNVIYGSLSWVNAVTWSLEVEIQFYILAPLVMLLFTIRGRTLRRTVLVLLTLACGIIQHQFVKVPRFELSILYTFQYFLAGLLLAEVFLLDLPRMRKHWLWDVAGFASLAYFYWAGHESWTAHALLPFAIGIIILAAMRGVAIQRFFANRVIAVIGGMCYSIYLLHLIVIAVVFKVSRRLVFPTVDFLGNYIVQFVLLTICTLAVSVLFYLLVERPCMDPDWPSKLSRRLFGNNELAVLDSAGITETQTQSQNHNQTLRR